MANPERLAVEQQLLYRDLARYYDLLYSFKDYRSEANRILDLVRQYGRSNGNDLLDVACGTGRHLEYLKERFHCVGVDVNQEMLDVARQRLPGIDLRQADMTQLDLGGQFDVITCLFGAIGYAKTYENLYQTLAGFSRHVKPGGVAIIGPWFTRDAFKAGTVHMTTYDGAEVKIARLGFSTAHGDLSIIQMEYLVAETGKGVSHYSDRHEMGLFDHGRTLGSMRAVGLDCQFVEDGLEHERGLFVGVKVRVSPSDQPTSRDLADLAMHGGALDWLAEEPDLYSREDGEPV
jgi:ubiquinone/menaquinone biosynthesis C-methylase UbiE